MTVPTRRSRPFVVALTVLSLLGAGCSDDADAGGSGSAGGAARTVEIFDTSVVHDIAVTFDETDYDAMIETYADSGDKTWIEATVTVDGVTYERAGLRLKGNSSLMGLGGGGLGGRPAAPGSGASTTTEGGATTTDERPSGGPACAHRRRGIGTPTTRPVCRGSSVSTSS